LLYKPTQHKQYNTIHFALETKHKTHTHTQHSTTTPRNKKVSKREQQFQIYKPKRKCSF
jgi:hypothetical protein